MVSAPYSLSGAVLLDGACRRRRDDRAQGGAGATTIEALERRNRARCWPRRIKARADGRSAPASASKPSVNLYTRGAAGAGDRPGQLPADRRGAPTSDVRHIILDLGAVTFPVLEGQSVGIISPAPAQMARRICRASIRFPARATARTPNTNNLSLTVKREPGGVCSNYLCDLAKGATRRPTGPFGATFLMPNDPQAKS